MTQFSSSLEFFTLFVCYLRIIFHTHHFPVSLGFLIFFEHLSTENKKRIPVRLKHLVRLQLSLLLLTEEGKPNN